MPVGALVDRWERRTVLLTINAVRCALMAGLARVKTAEERGPGTA